MPRPSSASDTRCSTWRPPWPATTRNARSRPAQNCATRPPRRRCFGGKQPHWWGRPLLGAETKDADYIFISFVLDHLPRGLIGLLLAVILCAAMSSSSAELSALTSTTVVDFYRRSLRPAASDRHYLVAARAFTLLWGLLALAFAAYASLIDNLIQAVNILASLFYGTILGIFLLAFFTRRIRGGSVFVSALLSEAAVLACFALTDLGFLWFKVIGCALVVTLAALIDVLRPASRDTPG
jgi:SSS family solute:Na+ symporter